jgi:hypothetical protein
VPPAVRQPLPAHVVDRAPSQEDSPYSTASGRQYGQGAERHPDCKPRSCPIMPTVDTLNTARCVQFARIRSVAVEPGDYGSGGRGFESLPARNTDPAS